MLKGGEGRTFTLGQVRFDWCIQRTGVRLVPIREQLRPLVGPRQNGVERRAEGLTPRREAVLHPRWYLGIDRPYHDAVGLQTAQLLPEHLLGDGGYGALQIREAHHLAPKEMKRSEERRVGK